MKLNNKVSLIIIFTLSFLIGASSIFISVIYTEMGIKEKRIQNILNSTYLTSYNLSVQIKSVNTTTGRIEASILNGNLPGGYKNIAFFVSKKTNIMLQNPVIKQGNLVRFSKKTRVSISSLSRGQMAVTSIVPNASGEFIARFVSVGIPFTGQLDTKK